MNMLRLVCNDSIFTEFICSVLNSYASYVQHHPMNKGSINYVTKLMLYLKKRANLTVDWLFREFHRAVYLL